MRGYLWSILIHIGLAVLLMFFGFKYLEPEEEEGLVIDFGVQGRGGSPIIQQTAPKSSVTPPPKQTSPPKAEPKAEKVNTQNFEDAPVVKKETKQEKTPEEIEREKELARQREIERQKQIERQRQLEEQARKDREAKEINERAANAFGKGKTQDEGTATGGSGSGTGTGFGSNEGAGAGGGSSTVSLSGRSLLGGLPKPDYNAQEEGLVVVEITVDRDGKVINAEPGKRGTTVSNSTLWNAAKRAALKTEFNSDPNAPLRQVGTITYRFKLQ